MFSNFNFNKIKNILFLIWKDKVDMAMLIIIVILFISSFITNNDFALGSIGFISIYTFGSIYRQAYWKYMYKTK